MSLPNIWTKVSNCRKEVFTKPGKYTKRLSRTKRKVFIYLPLLTFQIRLIPTINKSFTRSVVGKLLSNLKMESILGKIDN